MNLYKQLKAKVRELDKKPPSYTSFCKMLYTLEKLGLVEHTREEPADSRFPNAFPRHYYRVVKDKIDDHGWHDPGKALQNSAHDS